MFMFKSFVKLPEDNGKYTGSQGEANMTSRYLLKSFKHIKYNIYIYHIIIYDIMIIYIYQYIHIYIYISPVLGWCHNEEIHQPPQLFGVPGGHEFLQLRCPRPKAPRRSGAWQRPPHGRTVIRGPVPEIGMDNTRHVKNWLWLFGVLGVVVLKLRRASQTMRKKYTIFENNMKQKSKLDKIGPNAWMSIRPTRN